MKPLNTSIRHKYYLNRMVKTFCKVSSRRKYVYITEGEKQALNVRNKAYFDELVDDFNYKIQLVMPI